MKRDFNYLPIIGILLITGILGVIFESLLEDYSDIFRIVIGFVVNFIICSGLIHTRRGDFKDYILNIKRINLNVILVGVISDIISAIIVVLILVSAGINTYYSFENTSVKSSGVLVLLIAVMMIFELIFNYRNFVTSDERYLDYSFWQIFKLTVKTGVDLVLKTIKVFLKFFIVPIVLFIILLSGLIVQGPLSMLFLILIVISLGYIIFVMPVYLARISDIYIDYSGYEIEEDCSNDKNHDLENKNSEESTNLDN